MCVFYPPIPSQRKGICDPPSKTFYDGTLFPAGSVETFYETFLHQVNGPLFASYWLSPDKPIKVIDVVGSESSPDSAHSRSGGPESKQNPEEAKKVVCPSSETVHRIKWKFVGVCYFNWSWNSHACPHAVVVVQLSVASFTSLVPLWGRSMI